MKLGKLKVNVWAVVESVEPVTDASTPFADILCRVSVVGAFGSTGARDWFCVPKTMRPMYWRGEVVLLRYRQVGDNGPIAIMGISRNGADPRTARKSAKARKATQ